MLGKKEENESGELGQFTHLSKTSLVLDSRVFNETPLNSKRCHALLNKLLFTLYNGETFSGNDATAIFFNVIKTFQSKEMNLRRLMYVGIKELAPFAQDIMMATSSLIQDINNPKMEVSMKSEALRALGRIIDPSMVQSVERLLKQCMLDRNSVLASASLVTGIHLFFTNKEAVRRWATEITQALESVPRSSMAQYHALGLLYLIKAGDRVSISKMLSSVHKSPSGPFASVLFLKIYSTTQHTQQQSGTVIELKGYLRGKGKTEMVSLEAARVICEHPEAHGGELVYAVATLQGMLGSGRPLMRLAAIRTLHRLAHSHPGAVAACNREIEGLVGDSNRSIATFAITTLLKTGSEESVDRLVAQVSSYVSEIADEFKVVVVKAVRELCFKFPAKAAALLDFFSGILRDEGSFEYKQSVLQAIEDLLGLTTSEAGDLRDRVLLSLCEFIEDCEYPGLTVQVLYLLGEQAGSGSKVVRYIYNRMILEGPRVRIAAINALAKLNNNNVKPLLQMALNDLNEEVREAAHFALQSLERNVVPVEEREFVLDSRTAFDLEDLERKLREYQADVSNYAKPFDASKVAIVPREELLKPLVTASITELPSVTEKVPERFGLPVEELEKDGSTVLFSQEPKLLTDGNAECTVHVIKHLVAAANGDAQVLLEFVCENTEQDLEFTHLRVQCRADVLKQQEIERLGGLERKSCVVLVREKEADIQCLLTFRVNGSEERFSIDSVEIGFADLVIPQDVLEESMMEQEETFFLTAVNSVKDASNALKELIGGKVIVGEEGELVLSGQVPGRGLFRCQCVLQKHPQRPGVQLRMLVQAQEESIIHDIMSLIS